MTRFRFPGTVLTSVLAILLAAESLMAEPALTLPSLPLGPTKTVVEGTYQLSPPALQFDQTGHLHLAWFDQQGETRALRTVQLTAEKSVSATPTQVNPPSSEPDSLHQAPGLTIGPHQEVFITWARADKHPAAEFAADVMLSVSHDRGATFEPPRLVNDDGAPINHSFESLHAGADGIVSITWLDNRNKEKSGAGIHFARSRDGGQTIEKNRTMDGMACPCCRPMVTAAPDSSLWVAWRKTFAGNVRDIVVAHSTDAGQTFSAPTLVHKDGWVFPACPHRGPSIGFDRTGRVYIAWYTEGADEQPRLFVATSDDGGKTFSTPVSLHTSTTSVPDQLRMAVHPDGVVIAVWEEITGVRKRTVMRISLDRGRSFGPLQTLSDGAKAEYPTVAIHADGSVAISWTEHAWPNNRIVLRFGNLSSLLPSLAMTPAER